MYVPGGVDSVLGRYYDVCMDKEHKKKILRLAVTAGEIMMRSGAEIFRVEETITRICKACNVDNVEVFALPTGIFVTLDNDASGEGVSSYIRRVKGVDTDLNKISLVNQFSREFTTTDLTVEEGLVRLEQINKKKKYHIVFRIFAAAICAGSFAIIFGGNAADFCVAFVAGTICYTFSRLLSKYDINYFIIGFCSCAIAAFIALLISTTIPAASYQPIISGTLMLFVPGVAITNSIREFLTGDMLSGLARMIEAFLTAVSLAAGAGIVIQLWNVLGGVLL